MSDQDYKAELAILTDLILDLYTQHAALSTAVCRKCPAITVSDLRETVPELRKKMEGLPAIRALRQAFDLTTLEVAAKALKEFRD